ncbi:hypothetical protein A2707_03640 [Candidatus Saccharibacteria bacterium RIFCSPHIGHO2_01_FULL_45_15]|nr:MAG: hypothetical protein A2707_03640 [Candidatus Saccharibacteria bacterium RIFCSPHIGHO2_01_FULL_45_15]OGL28672.1 MAG: hypothetical protein A3C39_05460 [Candidatus Saccharibacteria bacterium RIFCSPHIGHO2_02_FULL_46_12]OGL31475.1 MAG: hypothetical protein A3E76_03645 [Candidatus Saccharibacteria bacterium RIFCSPHIGHO2_12_FULL_44_22]
MGSPLITKKLYGTATVGTKGQIVIPSDAREELNIQPGDRLYILNAMNGSGIVCLKEEMLESMVASLTAQVEDFRALQNKTKE